MDHISITQINMLGFCGEQYYRRYVLGDKIPPGISLIVGKCTDKTVNDDMTAKIETGELLPVEQIKDIAHDTLNVEWDHGVLLTEDEVKEDLKKVKGAAIDKTVRLSVLHRTDLAPKLNPTHVQRKWELELPGYPNIIGYIDLQEGTTSIRDTKTTARTPSEDAAHISEQLTIYALAGRVLDGKIPDKLFLDYLVDNKVPKVEIRESIRSEADFGPLFRRLEIALKMISSGLFMPTKQDNNPLCSPRYCGYYRTCPYVRQTIYPMVK
jgi:CRISPR/Cas system-associated exonuclease Cas4 (RecB family)